MADAITLDTTLVAGMMGLIGALLGAIIGGSATYLAAFVQHRVENKAKIASALTSVLSELLSNQTRLYVELDRCLPLWLSRMHLDDTNKRKLEIELKKVCYLPSYNMRTYDERFSDIMMSRYGEIIRQYYARIQHLNWISKEFQSNGLPQSEFDDYILNLRLSILYGDDLISELLVKYKGSLKKKYKGEDFFCYPKEDKQRAVVLALLSMTNLDHINRYFEGDPFDKDFIERSLRPVLNLISGEELNKHNCVVAARQIR